MAVLPALRRDLQLDQVDAAIDGSPRWTLSDPVTGRYFKLAPDALRLLRHWQLRDPQRVLKAANREPGLPLDHSALEQLSGFLARHDLLAASNAAQRSSYADKARDGKRHWWQKVLHQYLFFRVPLWRPDPLLNRCWPWLQKTGRPFLCYLLPLILLAGLYLVGRNWSSYLHAFPHLFSFSGLSSFALALLFTKFLHELGHAFMAKRAGCRVHSMGLAFIVLFPLFYTDVSDAWKLRDRKARLLIGAGGILAELLLAAIALLAWSLLPEGPARTAAFMLSGVTWVTTLLVNLNPLMRFDGYYLLSDWWRVDNLQERAFALCRWQLREYLFGYRQPPPENWSPGMQRKLLLWGYASWLWRFFLFLGIALLVYHFFIKAIGIILMLAELFWFILLPVVREISIWWNMRQASRAASVLRTSCILLALTAMLVIPWQGRIQLPAMLEAAAETTLYAPDAAQVVALHVQDRQPVKAGDLLLELQSPDLAFRLRIERQQLEILQLQRQRNASSAETVGDTRVVEQQLAESLARLRGLQNRAQQLQIRAPQDGVIRDLARDLAPGRWLADEQPLLRIISGDKPRIRGYLPERNLAQASAGMHGYFLTDDPALPRIAVTLTAVAPTAIPHLQQQALASDHRGPIAVRRNAQQQAIPLEAQYRTEFNITGESLAPPQPLRGMVVVDGEKASLLAALWRRVAALGIRESGF